VILFSFEEENIRFEEENTFVASIANLFPKISDFDRPERCRAGNGITPTKRIWNGYHAI
jgi:hypothetical protein